MAAQHNALLPHPPTTLPQDLLLKEGNVLCGPPKLLAEGFTLRGKR